MEKINILTAGDQFTREALAAYVMALNYEGLLGDSEYVDHEQQLSEELHRGSYDLVLVAGNGRMFVDALDELIKRDGAPKVMYLYTTSVNPKLEGIQTISIVGLETRRLLAAIKKAFQLKEGRG